MFYLYFNSYQYTDSCLRIVLNPIAGSKLYLFPDLFIYLINIFIEREYLTALHAAQIYRPSAYNKLYFPSTFPAQHCLSYHKKRMLWFHLLTHTKTPLPLLTSLEITIHTKGYAIMYICQ